MQPIGMAILSVFLKNFADANWNFDNSTPWDFDRAMQTWEFGDITTRDSISNGVVTVNDINDSLLKLVFSNMVANDIENVNIPGLS